MLCQLRSWALFCKRWVETFNCYCLPFIWSILEVEPHFWSLFRSISRNRVAFWINFEAFWEHFEIEVAFLKNFEAFLGTFWIESVGRIRVGFPPVGDSKENLYIHSWWSSISNTKGVQFFLSFKSRVANLVSVSILVFNCVELLFEKVQPQE